MSGPRFAFFDVDDTLVSVKSMFDFFPFWCARIGAPDAAKYFQDEFADARARGTRREDLNRLYYRFFKNMPLPLVEKVGREWFVHRFKENPAPFCDVAVSRLKTHRADGVEPVFVSGSMLPLLQPIATELGVRSILCTRLLVDARGHLTGEIGSPQTIGQGKAEAMTRFLSRHGAEPSDCFAYGDDISDLAMLEAVGVPVAVGASPDLLAVCRQRNWTHLSA